MESANAIKSFESCFGEARTRPLVLIGAKRLQYKPLECGLNSTNNEQFPPR